MRCGHFSVLLFCLAAAPYANNFNINFFFAVCSFFIIFLQNDRSNKNSVECRMSKAWVKAGRTCRIKFLKQCQCASVGHQTSSGHLVGSTRNVASLFLY